MKQYSNVSLLCMPFQDAIFKKKMGYCLEGLTSTAIPQISSSDVVKHSKEINLRILKGSI